jgi:hypothetical protein
MIIKLSRRSLVEEVCNIPPVEARAGIAFPRAVAERSEVELRRPEGNLKEKLFLPVIRYNILILVRGTRIPMPFLFLPALCGKEYYSYPHSAGKNNIPARRLVCDVAIRQLVCKFLSLV